MVCLHTKPDDLNRFRMHPTVFSQQDMLERLSPMWRGNGLIFKKCRPVFAKKAAETTRLVTVTSDGIETENTVNPGDFIVKNQTHAQEMYALDAEKFADRYEWLGSAKDGFDEYLPVGKITAIELTKELLHQLALPDEFLMATNWNETMIVKQGDFLAAPPDFSEVYRIARREFFETYTAV